jgi:hypothetical protein
VVGAKEDGSVTEITLLAADLVPVVQYESSGELVAVSHQLIQGIYK